MTAFGLVTLAIMWVSTMWNFIDIWRRKRSSKDHAQMNVEMAKLVDLTPLQIQVAMDAAMTAFTQRINEMQETTGGSGQ